MCEAEKGSSHFQQGQTPDDRKRAGICKTMRGDCCVGKMLSDLAILESLRDGKWIRRQGVVGHGEPNGAGFEGVVQAQADPTLGLPVHLVVVADAFEAALHGAVEVDTLGREDNVVESLGGHHAGDVVDVGVFEGGPPLDEHKGGFGVGVDDVVVLGVLRVGVYHVDDVGEGLLV